MTVIQTHDIIGKRVHHMRDTWMDPLHLPPWFVPLAIPAGTMKWGENGDTFSHDISPSQIKNATMESVPEVENNTNKMYTSASSPPQKKIEKHDKRAKHRNQEDETHGTNSASRENEDPHKHKACPQGHTGYSSEDPASNLHRKCDLKHIRHGEERHTQTPTGQENNANSDCSAETQPPNDAPEKEYLTPPPPPPATKH